MKTGTIVKFKTPMADEDANEKYVVVEDRSERLLVSPVDMLDWPIVPTMTVLTDEVEIAN